MADLLHRLTRSSAFQNSITIVILVAAVLVGLETYPSIVREHGSVLDVLDQIVLWIFVVEALFKIGAEGRRPWRYFADPWNVFDFAIVAVCFLPVDAQYVLVLRLARLLRVLKLVRALPRLQVLVRALLKSIPSMAYVGLLLALLFYVYAVAGTFLFGENDPVHFGTLPTSMLSLFETVTLEGWVDLMQIQAMGCDRFGFEGMEALCTNPSTSPIASPIYFVTFVLIGTMIILNLFIGVIMHGMEESRAELEREQAEERRSLLPPAPERTPVQSLVQLEEELGRVRESMAALRERMSS
ncbi:MAG: ion transporter [Deltaproteobacteria bacterium]|nr:ion transporter [Deltaproteobacteria bacterium]